MAYYYFIIISEVGLSPLGTAATSGLLYKPQMHKWNYKTKTDFK
jgi:hypothetical protein